MHNKIFWGAEGERRTRTCSVDGACETPSVISVRIRHSLSRSIELPVLMACMCKARVRCQAGMWCTTSGTPTLAPRITALAHCRPQLLDVSYAWYRGSQECFFNKCSSVCGNYRASQPKAKPVTAWGRQDFPASPGIVKESSIERIGKRSECHPRGPETRSSLSTKLLPFVAVVTKA